MENQTPTLQASEEDFRTDILASSGDLLSSESSPQELYDFQKKGIDFLASRKRAILADDQGLGKTVQAIKAADVALKRLSQVTIICPSSLVSNWYDEFYRWAEKDFGLKCFTYYQFSNDPPITNEKPDLIIIDEAHFIRNTKSNRTQALFKWVIENHHKNPGSYLWLLTATPFVNSAADLYSLLKFCNPKIRYTNYFHFANSFAYRQTKTFGKTPNGKDRVQVTYKGFKKETLPHLKAELRPFYIRRKKSKVLSELPPITERTLYLNLSDNDQMVFDDLGLTLNHKLSEESQELINEFESNKHSSRLAKYRKTLSDIKEPLICEYLVSQLQNGKPLVFMAHHKDLIYGLESKLHKYSPATLTGDTSTKVRGKIVKDFQEGKHQIFLGNIQAAGVGLTLTRADHIVFGELPWTYAELIQARDRVHRISQTNPVLVSYLLLNDTLDEAMYRIIQNKRKGFEEVVG